MSNKKPPAGAPVWMTTFADLMSLLLTLFVLMLTFAKMDVEKYQQLAGSMKNAFGVQYLKKLAGIIEEDGGPMGVTTKRKVPKAVVELQIDDTIGEDVPVVKEPEDNLAETVSQAVAEQISQQMANVEEREGEVIVRFPGKFAFPSGAESLTSEFLIALNNLATVIKKSEGDIIIAGHTDDRPIKTARFRSNWDLSAARANSVVHYLLEFTTVESSRLAAMGYADSRPLAPNDTDENRALNRRVEVIFRKANTAKKPPANDEGAGQPTTEKTPIPDSG
ncbi:MAG: OmpA family protein [Rhodospirillaceae bacterium]|jgi:chemotaxis protein MotB|nr:OmpA family protein [Rhodospirillaceae bacterium]MBT5244469.1 OmpA family protein [Rhodospirillaceae bacterium]MBT5560726.1 OmpA family protein [Rhodospirillaceae bacterium]MBT6242444.1 OmpA family protein [Rhodospirillaceae bacterium]MBT7136768.1 OmpA family protein [Rhodospirillaceae bacterium]